MSSASPISNVGDDVLWNIFNLIASARPELLREKHEHSLTTIRKSSHVCLRWRHLILESSSLWGGMIDMTIIGRSSEEWGTLIMSRAKEAPLRVYGEVHGKYEATRRFFNALLPTNWHQISELDVCVFAIERFDRQIWSVFWERPAVNLEHLSVAIPQPPPDSFRPLNAEENGHLLFSDCAPKLRIFNFPELNIPSEASWTHGLRELTLCAHLSPSQVVEIVSRAQHLESLHIQKPNFCNHTSTSISSHFRQIGLPCLRQLHIRSTLQTSLVLLSLISFPGDALRDMEVIARDFRAPARLEDIESFILIIPIYVRRFLAFNDVTWFGIVMYDTTVDLSLQPREFNYDFDYSYPTPRLRIRFDAETFPATSRSHSRLVRALTTCPLASVKTLSLSISDSASSLITAEPDLHTLLLSFSGVETLIIEDQSLQNLNAVDTFDPWVFPFLKKLQLGSMMQPCFRPQYFDDLKLFLSRKLDIGQPVPVLDISEIGRSQQEQDWSFLDTIDSLKVIYKSEVVGEVREYVCGTGSPEVLNFSILSNVSFAY